MGDFNLEHWAREWLLDRGVSEAWASYATLTMDVILVIVISWLGDWLGRRIILRVVSTYVKRSSNTYDDVFLEKKVFRGLAHLIPALIIYYSIPLLFEDTGISVKFMERLVIIYMIIVVMNVINRFLKALEEIAFHLNRFEGKPVSSYKQVFSIVNYVIGSVIIISMVIGKSPLSIITAFGAATAVILLIFRDTILGLVASIQISANDMVRLGDWVSMEKYGADGDVIQITLTTVKVRNFDKTITTVPTYAFISDSFKNWRGMQSEGVRRIMRSITLDLNTVRFVDEDLLNRLQKVERIQDYMETRQKEIDQYNYDHGNNKQVLLNGRHMTNIGVFRAYIKNYLEEHPLVSKEQSIMVRQLEPGANGVALQVYCFSSTTVWMEYEQLQSFIFDHLLAAVTTFDLRLFQNPTGSDFSAFLEKG